jgi:hypothetical protein
MSRHRWGQEGARRVRLQRSPSPEVLNAFLTTRTHRALRDRRLRRSRNIGRGDGRRRGRPVTQRKPRTGAERSPQDPDNRQATRPAGKQPPRKASSLARPIDSLTGCAPTALGFSVPRVRNQRLLAHSAGLREVAFAWRVSRRVESCAVSIPGYARVRADVVTPPFPGHRCLERGEHFTTPSTRARGPQDVLRACDRGRVWPELNARLDRRPDRRHRGAAGAEHRQAV